MSSNKPILDQINIVSGDPAAAVAFYRRLGLNIPDGHIWRTITGLHHVSAQSRGTDAPIDLEIDSEAFAAVWNQAWKGGKALRGRLVVGFKLTSRAAVDETYADLAGAGYRGLQPPYDAFWGARYAVVEDPDGVAVGLMSPKDEAHRFAPPAV